MRVWRCLQDKVNVLLELGYSGDRGFSGRECVLKNLNKEAITNRLHATPWLDAACCSRLTMSEMEEWDTKTPAARPTRSACSL